MPETIQRLLSKRQAAPLLGVSYRTLSSRAWRERVGVPAFRVGALLRFDEAELLEWLRRQREVHTPVGA